ncbi:MAG: peptidylprolyl isomerase [Sphingomonadales bacterium]
MIEHARRAAWTMLRRAGKARASAMGASLLALLLGGWPAQAQIASVTENAAEDPQSQIMRAVAIVNEDVISVFDVDRRLSLVLASTGGRPSPQEVEQLRQQVLRGLVDEKLQMQEAREHDISIESQMLEGFFANIARNFNQTPEQFEKFLEENGTSRAALEEQIRVEAAWSELVQRRLEPQINIGDGEVEDVLQRLEESKGEFEYNLGEIFLSFSPENEGQVRLTATRIAERIKEGAPFEAFARQFSDSATAAVGGDMGWLAESQLNADIRLAVRDMRVNAVSEPLRTAGGYQILYLRDRRRILSADPLDQQFRLKQIFWAAEGGEAQDKAPMVADLRRRLPATIACDEVEQLAERLEATQSGELGVLRLRDLPPELRQQVEGLEAGDIAPPIAFPAGVRALVVCETREPQVRPPTYDDIYDQLSQQRLSMMARRYLRDLRRDAIVDYR